MTRYLSIGTSSSLEIRRASRETSSMFSKRNAEKPERSLNDFKARKIMVKYRFVNDFYARSGSRPKRSFKSFKTGFFSAR
jgi:hypothetical protein